MVERSRVPVEGWHLVSTFQDTPVVGTADADTLRSSQFAVMPGVDTADAETMNVLRFPNIRF